ncbi:dihydroneopterin aldolase [Arenibaculum sp.]|jgi:dihydroneopterin aldolase|uniref:dihydroneopterin aldolase n=1 Tax=Arenibaculum sp. TaxID=2865862 RepID=UPI002E16198A|nr:dihydroneopterin aldolase [Arenibaculum sp.]
MNKLFAQVTAPRTRRSDRSLVRVFVRDLVLDARIGVYAHEHGRTQRIRINIDLGADLPVRGTDALADVVSYETVVTGVREIVASGHVNLVETLAEHIADRCLVDRRVRTVRVRVEKLDVFPDAASAGVEIERVAE